MSRCIAGYTVNSVFSAALFSDTHQLADPVQHQVDDLLADGVVAAGVVVGGVFFAGDELLGVEQLPVRPTAHLIWRDANTRSDSSEHNRVIKITRRQS